MSGTFRKATSKHATLKLPRHEVFGLRHFTLERVGDEHAPAQVVTGSCQVGSHSLNDVHIDDPTVSGFHCELGVGREGAWIKDVGSSNGTEVDGLRVKEAFLRDGSLIRLGQVTLRFRLLNEASEAPVSKSESFGALLGGSAVMRTCFAQLERMAGTSRPVLLEGESGTGKSAAAEAIHDAGPRKDAPFLTVDCGAASDDDLAVVLFGRDNPRRLSAFEEVGNGTLFLDEVSELSPDLQARLMPVLERGELTRTGSPVVVTVRARIVASTREDLRKLVNAGRFRNELYYRLAVVRVTMPPLREHSEDIPDLVDAFLERIGADEEAAETLRTREFIDRLRLGAWPGNVRELFNHVERCLVMRTALAPQELAARGQGSAPVDASRPYAEARQHAVDAFERDYVEALVKLHGGNVSAASRAAGMDRAYLHRLLRRHGLKG